MKLQFKITGILILTVFLSTIVSLLFINIFLKYFDQSYSRNDIEVIAADVAFEISRNNLNEPLYVSKILETAKKKYKNFDFSYMNEKRELIAYTGAVPEKPDFKKMEQHFINEEKLVKSEPRNDFDLIDTFKPHDLVIRKSVVQGDIFRGFIFVSVKKEFTLPFYIRVNTDKRTLIYAVFIIAVFVIILFSYIIVFLFTYPLIHRLRLLFSGITDFKPDAPFEPLADKRKDEISVIAGTFNKMAENINQHYSDLTGFYAQRQELMKNLSHDFRTPLTSILGYSVSLDENLYENEDELKEDIRIIRRKAEYMTQLFDELMELTRLDNNTYVIQNSEYNLAELVREILIEYLPQLEKDNYTTETEIPESIILRGDFKRISRAVRNVIDNVIRHASNGKYLGVLLRETGNGFVQLKISDKGPGVEDSVKIFDRFYKSSSGGGMGLGLAIAKEIVEKHSGKIFAQQNSNGGTTIVIELPL